MIFLTKIMRCACFAYRFCFVSACIVFYFSAQAFDLNDVENKLEQGKDFIDKNLNYVDGHINRYLDGYINFPDVRHLPFLPAVEDMLDSRELDGSVGFYFYNNLIPPKININIVRRDLVITKRTHGFHNGITASCDKALQLVLASFQERALKENANAVINIISYNRKQAYSDASNYECRDGIFYSVVTLRGTLARLQYID